MRQNAIVALFVLMSHLFFLLPVFVLPDLLAALLDHATHSVMTSNSIFLFSSNEFLRTSFFKPPGYFRNKRQDRWFYTFREPVSNKILFI